MSVFDRELDGIPGDKLARRGFPHLPCLRCGEVGDVYVKLSDVCTFCCTQCDDEFPAAKLAEAIRGYAAVLDWIAKAPAIG